MGPPAPAVEQRELYVIVLAIIAALRRLYDRVESAGNTVADGEPTIEYVGLDRLNASAQALPCGMVDGRRVTHSGAGGANLERATYSLRARQVGQPEK